MKKADLITGVVLLVLSGYVIREAWLMPPSATFGPGSGFLPFWLGVLLAVLAVILLATAWHREATEKDMKSPFPGAKALIAIGSVISFCLKSWDFWRIRSCTWRFFWGSWSVRNGS
jgi:cation transport ATPase